MTQRLRALIFDVDGTLAETEELHRRAFNETFADAGIGWHWDRPDYKRLLRITGGQERMRAYRDMTGQAQPDNARIAALHADKTARYGTLLQGGALELREGVQDLVAAGRRAGLKVAVATTTSRINVDALCRACWDLPADAVFDAIAAGDDVARKKPAPDLFRLALDRLGLSASEALAFEDSVAGLSAATAAGLATIVTPSSYTDGDDFGPATHICPSLAFQHLPEDLLRYVNDL